MHTFLSVSYTVFVATLLTTFVYLFTLCFWPWPWLCIGSLCISGTFATVRKGIRIKDGKEFAIKIIGENSQYVHVAECGVSYACLDALLAHISTAAEYMRECYMIFCAVSYVCRTEWVHRAPVCGAKQTTAILSFVAILLFPLSFCTHTFPFYLSPLSLSWLRLSCHICLLCLPQTRPICERVVTPSYQRSPFSSMSDTRTFCTWNKCSRQRSKSASY